MRRLADAERIRAFMDAVGRAANKEIRLYFTGGATAVLSGWRSSTIDVDILMIPEEDRVFRFPAIDPASFRRAAERVCRPEDPLRTP